MQTYTETEATEEALRLFIRKARRLHPDAFQDVWNKLPEGAQLALTQTEHRADDRRTLGPARTWAVAEEPTEE